MLVAGGCNGWCKENPAITSAEMYDPDTNQWSKVADLPVPINRYLLPFSIIVDSTHGEMFTSSNFFITLTSWKNEWATAQLCVLSSHATIIKLMDLNLS